MNNAITRLYGMVAGLQMLLNLHITNSSSEKDLKKLRAMIEQIKEGIEEESKHKQSEFFTFYKEGTMGILNTAIDIGEDPSDEKQETKNDS